ncbi:MAG: hypothetical protein MPW15_26355 [Candidatus Manganitrophus sp.]|nr:hypothetical protein [Candidatus Manganitrophus sp.]
MAKKEDPCGESALWHVGIDEFPMNDENQTAYQVATSELTAEPRKRKNSIGGLPIGPRPIKRRWSWSCTASPSTGRTTIP